MKTKEQLSFPTFDDARKMLSSRRGRSPYNEGTELMEVFEALEVFTREIQAHPKVPDEELLHLLNIGGVIAEFGARCLYLRTGRDDLHWRPAGSDGIPFIVDRIDWEDFLFTSRERDKLIQRIS